MTDQSVLQEAPVERLGKANAAVVELHERGADKEALPRAIEVLAQAEALFGSDDPRTITIVGNLASVYQSLGRYDDAERLYRRALETSERISGPEDRRTLLCIHNLGYFYHSQRQYLQAERYYSRALEGRERVLGPDHRETLTSINNMGSVRQYQGRYGEAEPLYRRAYEARERVFGPGDRDTLESASNLASLYDAWERYGEAEVLCRRALETCERVLGPDDPGTIHSVNNLATLCQSRRLYVEAEALFLRALKARERVPGPNHRDTLISVNNLAGLYDTMGRFDDAEPLFSLALEVRERILGPDDPETLQSVNNLAGVYLSQRRYADAEPLFRRALKDRKRVLGPNHPDTLSTRGNLSCLLVLTGRVKPALRELRALDLGLRKWLDTEIRTTRAAEMRRKALKLASVYHNAAFSVALKHRSPAGDAFAAELVLRWKKRLIQEDAVLNRLARECRDPDLAASIATVRSGRSTLSNVAFADTVDAEEVRRLRNILEEAEARLRAKSAVYNRHQAVKAARAREVTRALPKRSALLEYRFFVPFDLDTWTPGESHMLAVILSPGKMPVPVDLGAATPIAAAQSSLSEYRGAGRHLATGPDQARPVKPFESFARLACEQLFAPLRIYLRDIETLYIAPDGILSAFPFEALVDKSGTLLLDQYKVHILQTGRDLVAGNRPMSGKGLVALGGVDFGPKPTVPSPPAMATVDLVDAPMETLAVAALIKSRGQIGGFDPLKESLAEVNNIARDYAASRPEEPKPLVLKNNDATERALRELSPPPRVLHLATHGYYLETGSIEGEPLLQSGIALTGANKALEGKIGPDGENGVLHALEAQTLNLSGTELVVLSACDTGKGVLDYSEGLEGLPRALFVAGARNVLVALWSVGDREARTFMERFYRIWLAQSVSDPWLAVRETKLAFVSSNIPTERDPAAWAPFILVEG